MELRRGDDDRYAVQFRYRAPHSAAETRPGGGWASIDLAGLNEMRLEPVNYGMVLAKSLFDDPGVRTPFETARSSAESLNVPLRLRLLIDETAPELHGVWWETLRDPRDGACLCTDENVLLSRYALTTDYRPIRLRLKSDLRALLVVANPSNLEEYPFLSPIDAEQELEAARQGLGQIHASLLPQPGSDRRASLGSLFEELRQTDYDIVYLVCHGTMADGQSWLWLEDEQGRVARVAGDELVARMHQLRDGRPGLIVLASCQSADSTAGEALKALGPRLTAAGVPAVIAIQGSISMETVTRFMSVFFEELQQDGVIDRATAVARGRVQKRPDFWMPVLFMRLEQGSIWSGFTESGAFRKWPALRSLIEDKRITPILGSGLVEPLLGSMREIASNWAQLYGYPMFEYEHNSLPQITQYLSVEQYEDFPKTELEKHLRREIQEKHRRELPEALLEERASLDELINQLGTDRRSRVPWDAYRILAQLDLPVYITANLNKLLESALEEAGKSPQTVISPWNDYVVHTEPRYGLASQSDGPPTPENPLVYHLFGRLDQPDSVALTEDDYFQYLIGLTRNRDLVPTSIQEALTDKALLFLGFHLEDWDFRVLFQSLLSFESGELRKSPKKDFVNVAVQLEPEGLANPEVARRYLESYLGKENIYLFWGSTEDFIKELMFYLPTRNGNYGS
ncbi:MAG TPA: CHAT domain-containing protein, partial [Candidatus Binatia bacterium]|nr:CHAT domain-containing protein [Candidatus Binatia bacterium]